MTTPHPCRRNGAARRRRAATALLLVAVGLAGCSSGGSDSATSDSATSDSATSDSATSDSATSDSATSATEEATTSAPADDIDFTDPQGTYRLTVPATWQSNPGAVVVEVEVWMVAEPKDGFAPNVNVLTQPAPGVTVQQYLDASVASAPPTSETFELLDSGLIEGANGQQLGMMRYRSNELQSLGIFTITSDGNVVVATLNAPPGRFDEIHDAVLPYLLTLEPIG